MNLVNCSNYSAVLAEHCPHYYYYYYYYYYYCVAFLISCISSLAIVSVCLSHTG